MARPSTNDPLDKFRWSVTVDGFTRLGFTEVETPSHNITVNKYPEGGAHLWPLQIVDSIEYKPITLSRGVTKDQSFYFWARGPFDALTTASTDTTVTSFPQGTYKRTVTISHLDRTGVVIKSYVLKNAYPIAFKAASDFSSSSDDGLSIESITLVYEQYTVQDANGNSLDPFGITNIVDKLINNF